MGIWRRVPLICLAVLFGLSATACGSGGASAKSGQFIIYSADPANQQAEQAAMQKSFGDPNNVKVSIVAYPVASFLSQFQNAVRSRAEVDGLLLNGQNVTFLRSKQLVLPVDDIVDQNAMQPGALTPFRSRGHLYAAGTGSLNTSMMAVNSDLIAKYHLVVPKTFADIRADVAKLKGTGVSLFGFGGATTFQWPLWYMEMLQQTSADKPIPLTTSTVSTGSPKFTADPYVRAMDLMRQLGASGAFEPGLIGTTNVAAQANFTAGKSVLYWYGSWIISKLLSQAKFHTAIAPFPSFVSGVKPRPTGGVGGAVALYAHVPADKVDLAKKFVQYVTSTQGCAQQMQIADQGFPLPATKNTPTGTLTALDKQVSAQYTANTFTFLDWYWPAAVTTQFQSSIQAVVGQQRSAQAAMSGIQAAVGTS